jgi:hypothetical protein
VIHTLLPLNMYSVGYELVHGRPYSPLEAMLLKAVLETPPDGSSTFADLRSVFLVHDRLLTEALVTLIQEGWVAMRQLGQEMHYMVTDDGKRTVESGRHPESIQVRTRRQRIARERLTGQLIRASEIMMFTRGMLRRAANGKAFHPGLPPRVQRTKLNVGEVERLLPRSDQQQEWIRWIDPAVRVSQDVHYLPIQVDLESGHVFGLPPQWHSLSEVVIKLITENADEFDHDPEFQEAVLALARKNSGRTSVDRGEPRALAEEYLTAPVTCTDIAVSALEAHRLLDDFVATATGSVLIIANGLTESSAAAVKALVVSFLKRGVNVDLMWSGEQDDDKAVRTVLQQARGDSGAAKVTLLSTARDVTTDLVLGTTRTGPVALTGASLFARANHGVTTRITGYSALASLARICSGWWEENAGDDTAIAVFRWRHTAEEWASEGARDSSASRTVDACGCGNDAEAGTVSLVAAHHLPAKLQTHASADPALGQWFLDTDDHLMVATAGENSMYFVFTGPIRPHLLKRLHAG